jgi:hypothetical protein
MENGTAPQERPPQPPEPKVAGPLAWLVGAAVIALLAGIAYWWYATHHAKPVAQAVEPEERAQASTAETAAEVARKAEPPVRYPIERVAEAQGGTDPLQPAGGSALPLPGLDESDAAVLGALDAVIDARTLREVIVPTEIVRRFVVTIDNLPREIVPGRLRAMRAAPGGFAIARTDGRTTQAAENAGRYTVAVGLATSVDLRRLVAIYVKFYPLLQQEYRALGYPNSHFNDRVVEAIDDLLAAPEPREPPALVQPKVLFQYADPALESLSAGQKMMIRMGPAHAQRVKARLKELRGILAGQATAR